MIKVLFVRSGNGGIDPISTNQGKSLEQFGIQVSYYDIIGKGVFGYLKNILPLSREIKKLSPDIIHAHYSISGFLLTIANWKNKKVISLMGSDLINTALFYRWIIKIFIKYFWKQTIVKSEEMFNILNNRKVAVIPNGVDISLFKSTNISHAQLILGWEKDKLHILFCSSPERKEKNFNLAKDSVEMLNAKFYNSSIEIHCLRNVPHEQVPIYLSASHIILLTSIYEGSPNIIKEAMACNSPIVSTDVGDVKEILGDTKGCYICGFEPEDVSAQIKNALDFAITNNRTNGRDIIINKGLDSKSIAKKIITIYEQVLTL